MARGSTRALWSRAGPDLASAPVSWSARPSIAVKQKSKNQQTDYGRNRLTQEK
ncbi:hypothetical protein FMEAI12_1810040 [Parafrankia sp. Ea1.12]|nr:hypothetical protein FMEAI12_1810040 [Parafrankia sp. Ea1.12]